ncbi:MAG TPA: hypothetical protein VFB54_06830 [Burkholderiales bacterium]|nr:hypothetical protein [Burkholderiales bacterium]
MNRITLSPKLALTALAALLAAPLAQAQSDEHYRSIFPGNVSNVIDEINGNDARDNRDATILRNDVPLRQGPTEYRETEMSRSTMTTTRTQESGRATTRAAAGLPATAVMEAGKGTITQPQAATATTTEQNASSPAGTATGAADSAVVHDRTYYQSTSPRAVMPSDGGGEIGVPAPAGVQSQTDTFEGPRDTAAGVESTRGAGGAGAGAGR